MAAEVVAPHPRPTALPDFEWDVAVVGLGYVGLPTALGLHATGASVLGIDVSEPRLQRIRTRAADLGELDAHRLGHALSHPGFGLVADPALLAGARTVVVCVPTPVDDHRSPDLGPLRAACAGVVAAAVPGQTLVLTSTSYVGSTRELLVEPLARRGLHAGVDVHVAFSPERINPGAATVPAHGVPRVVGGATAACTEAAAAVLAPAAGGIHRVASSDVAEMSKLVENTFRAVNIALANEFADICQTLDLPVVDVIDAAATKPYGFMPFYPGPGVGGQCIPCDPHYLLWQLRAARHTSPLVEQAMGSIATRPRRIVTRVREVLDGRGVDGARILVLGVAYKPDVEDVRESPAIAIIDELRSAGAEVLIHDPLVGALGLPDGAVLRSVPDPSAVDADLVLLHTRHACLDLGWLVRARAVLDATYRLAGVPHSEVP